MQSREGSVGSTRRGAIRRLSYGLIAEITFSHETEVGIAEK